MKNEFRKSVLLTLGMIIGLLVIIEITLFATLLEVKAEELEFHEMTATAYCLQGQTASGEWVREGICASKSEWIGKTAAIYINDDDTVGDFLGYYEVKDTGGEAIKKGFVIDIWMENYDDCIQFGRPDVYVLIIEDEECQQVTE